MPEMPEPVTSEEPKKRGRKTAKQKVQELMKHIKKPLSHIKCSVSFSVPQEFAEALSASNASSRLSSASKNQDGRELDSVIQEGKTRSMRKKIKELTVAGPKQSLKARRLGLE